MKESLLIIHQGALGDFVLFLPSLLFLKNYYARIGIFCSEKNRKIVSYFDLADTFPIESKIFSLLFSERPPSEALEKFRSFSEILIFSFSGYLKERLSSLVPSKIYQIPPRPDPKEKIHVADYIRKKIEEEGLADNVKFVFPEFSTEKKKTFIHPGSGSKRKRWSIYNFIRLYEMLSSEGIDTDFIIGPAEEDLYDILRLYVPSEKIHLLDDPFDLILLLKQSFGFIGNDSGVTHLCAFLGIPSVAIFGPSDPVRWRPLGKKVKVMRADINCEPCFEIKDENCKDQRCLNISPEDVFKNYLYLISSEHPL